MNPGEVATILRRALEGSERGLGRLQAEVTDALLDRLSSTRGDARVALTALEVAVRTTETGLDGYRHIVEATVVEALGLARLASDKGGEAHDNLASALIQEQANNNFPSCGASRGCHVVRFSEPVPPATSEA